MGNIFYLAQIFDTLSCVSILFFIITAVGLICSIIYYHVSADFRNRYSEYTEEEHINSGKMVRRLIPLIIIFALGIIFIPTKKTYLFMVGGKTIDNVIEKNPDIEELPANTLNLLNEYIKAKTDDLKEK